MSGRARSYADAAGVVAAEVCLLAFFWWSGHIFGAPSIFHLWSWLAAAPPAKAFTALFRLVGLVCSGWLCAGTIAYAVARAFVGARRLPAGRWLTLPLARRAIDAAMAASIIASSVTVAGATAGASPAPVTTHAGVAPGRAPAPAARPGAGAPTGSREGGVAFRENATPPGRTAHQGAEGPRALPGRHIPHPGTGAHGAFPGNGATSAVADVPSPANAFAGLAPGTKVVVVKPGDCLSVLAERHLGDWRLDAEIERLNSGRLQPDGRRLEGDHWIFPGWVLVMPSRAVGTITVAGPAQVEHSPGNRANPPDAGGPSTAGGEKGDHATHPPAPVPKAPATARPHGAPQHVESPVRSGKSETHHKARHKTSGSERAGSQAPAPVPTIGGLGALAASSVLWRLDRLRQEKMHGRPRGRVLVKDREDVRKAEAKARALHGEEALQWADSGLRYLTALVEQLVQARSSDVPDLVCARVGRRGLEVLMSPLPQGPLGWFSPSGPGWLRLEPEISLEELKVLAHDRWSAWPAVICVGEHDGGTLLFNLEFAGVLSVDGPPGAQEAALEAWLLELAAHPWCEEMLAGVYSCGQAVATATPVPADGELALAERLDGISEANQAVFGTRSIASLRASACEALPNVVALFPGVPENARRCALEAAVARTSGVCALVAGPVRPAPWTLVLADDGRGCLQGTIDGGAVSLEVLTVPDVDGARLLSEALSTAGAADGYVDAPVTPENAAGEVPEGGTGAGEVEICVLGPLEIVGTGTGEVAPSRRSAALAVLVYLACHRRPVPVEELSTALWPLEAGSANFSGPQRKTVMNVISRARALIGYGEGGRDRVLYSAEGYFLAPDVTCDLDRFRLLVRRAAAPSPGPGPGLREALALVRGEPFAGAASSQFFEWALAEHLDLAVMAEVLDAAETLGRQALERDDYQLAIEAARKGLVMDPVREQLCCIWMEAAGRRGDLVEVDQVYRRLGQVLRQRLHPLQEPHESTRRVWAAYCRRDLAGSAKGTPMSGISPWDI